MYIVLFIFRKLLWQYMALEVEAEKKNFLVQLEVCPVVPHVLTLTLSTLFPTWRLHLPFELISCQLIWTGLWLLSLIWHLITLRPSLSGLPIVSLPHPSCGKNYTVLLMWELRVLYLAYYHFKSILARTSFIFFPLHLPTSLPMCHVLVNRVKISPDKQFRNPGVT